MLFGCKKHKQPCTWLPGHAACARGPCHAPASVSAQQKILLATWRCTATALLQFALQPARVLLAAPQQASAKLILSCFSQVPHCTNNQNVGNTMQMSLRLHGRVSLHKRGCIGLQIARAQPTGTVPRTVLQARKHVL